MTKTRFTGLRGFVNKLNEATERREGHKPSSDTQLYSKIHKELEQITTHPLVEDVFVRTHEPMPKLVVKTAPITIAMSSQVYDIGRCEIQYLVYSKVRIHNTDREKLTKQRLIHHPHVADGFPCFGDELMVAITRSIRNGDMAIANQAVLNFLTSPPGVDGMKRLQLFPFYTKNSRNRSSTKRVKRYE